MPIVWMTAWIAAVGGSFLLVGWLGARVLPGQAAAFQMEVPPLRRPRLANVVVKTLTRMQWYFLEVLPLFLLAEADKAVRRRSKPGGKAGVHDR